MANYKWIAGGLGFVLSGPIGGLLGLGLGWVIDSISDDGGDSVQYRNTTQRNDFNVSLLVLIAAVMKADGRIVKAELDFVKQQMVNLLGINAAREAVRMLGDLVKQDIPVEDVCHQIRKNVDYSSRLQIIHLLYGISAVDGVFDSRELTVIGIIGRELGISQADLISIQSMFIKDNGDWAYKVLEIDASATNDEIKKAYREMAKRYHPDKVSHLGEEHAKIANEKFGKVNEAYEKIKKDRNIV